MVRAITKRSPLLRLEDLPRKTILWRFRITLENVGRVGRVGSDDDPGDNAPGHGPSCFCEECLPI
jgi:hypothetical protein